MSDRSSSDKIFIDRYRLHYLFIHEFNDLQKEEITIALITHDIGVLAEASDRIIIMNEGSIVEKGKTSKVLVTPEHAYTKHLLSCVPEWLK